MSRTIFHLIAATSTKQGSGILSLLPLVLIFVAMYFLLLRPQRKRQKEARALQTGLSEGDEVVLNSGIYGYITAIEEDYVWLDIAEHSPGKSVEIRVTRSAVARIINKVANPSAPDAN